MKKRILLTLMLVACVCVLCACQSGGPQYTVVESQKPQEQATQSLGTVTTDVPVADDVIDYDDGSYDPTSEEGLGNWEDIATEVPATEVPTLRSEYAGATPVLLDPIDKPTPTPVPPITFTHQTYEATKLHLTFDAPSGWLVDDSVADTYVLTNPDPSMSYAASLTVTATAVSSQMNKDALSTQVSSMLNTLKASAEVKSFSPSRVDERSLMDQTGMYANYTAVLTNGEEIAGRIQAACVNKVLYTVHITYPQAYKDTYVKQVYNTLRDTIKVTQ